MRRSPIFVLFVAFVAALAAGTSPPLEAKEQYPLAFTIQSETGTALQGAAVAISAESGEPFTAQGTTDKRGRFLTKLPDFTRVYRFAVTKESFARFEQAVDFSTQNLLAGQTAELSITLLQENQAVRLFNEGVQALRNGQPAAAKEKLLESTKADPNLGQAWSALSMVAADEKNWQETLEYAAKAEGILGPDQTLQHTRYEALKALGRKDEALALLEGIAVKYPSADTARLLFNQGADAFVEGLNEAAKNRFIQAYLMEPALYQAHSALAEVLIKEKNLVSALGELEVASNLAPSDKKIAQRRIEVLRALGRIEDAEAAQKKLDEPGG